MTGILLIGLLGAAVIGFVTAWKWRQLRLGAAVQSLELRLKLRERDLRLAEERLRRLEAERWRPAGVAEVVTTEVEVDADGLPKRPVPAAVHAELLGLQHTCAVQSAELTQLQRDLAARSAEVTTLRAQLDAVGRGAEPNDSVSATEKPGKQRRSRR
jgi:hypothetical protein